ncbi:MAG TPA: GerMN domain-containing protein [Feifaniaceae bacterium]|nr:GerMN domain-containing protein [Feifaniaceae bacterium]
MLHKKRYTPAVLALCLLLALLMSACSTGVFNEKGLEQAVDSDAGFRRTVLYFQTDDGLMVPVMKLLPWEEGIGRAALNQLVDTADNQISAAAMGLKNVVPQGVTFVLSISDDAVATLNIKDLPALESAEAEQALVTAVVNTLTEFSTIDQVQLKFDGKIKSKLSHGTRVKDAMRTLPLNEEPMPVSADGENMEYRVTLYFPNQSGSLHVPVTRPVAQEPDLEVAMRELVFGPVDTALRNCFPEGTQVLSASVVDDMATVNFSKEFADISDTPDLEALALTCMQLTARQFGASIASLQVQVDGKDYDSGAVETMAIPIYDNEYR